LITPESLAKTSESSQQIALFAWAALEAIQRPELKNLFSIPNGGFRNPREAARLKAEGARAGVPDVCLAWPANGYHALYIELKVGKNRTSEDQDKWLARLTQAGNKTAVCYGWEAARNEINNYLRRT
jgi:hypothetical protein